jgi:integrase
MKRTFRHLLTEYYNSPEFKRLSKSSQYHYKLIMEMLVIDHDIAHRPVATMRREHVKKIVAWNAHRPGTANNILAKLKILIHFAIDLDWRETDPTLRIKGYELDGYHTWTDREISQFEAAFAPETVQRRAFGLILYTGQRIGDCASMTWDQVTGGEVEVVQEKTGTTVTVPMHPQLIDLIGREGEGPIIRSRFGRCYQKNTLGIIMQNAYTHAGLPDRCVSHGLRKAAARRLAEAGCSPHEIMAITGHQTLKEVERYTAAVSRKRLARSAIAKLPLTY